MGHADSVTMDGDKPCRPIPVFFGTSDMLRFSVHLSFSIMPIPRSFLAACLAMAVASSLVLSSITVAQAQDDFFNPPLEPSRTPKSQDAKSPIFSFGRFEGDFKSLCRELEGDGRRLRIVQIAEGGAKREKECITCRSFWKMVVSACVSAGPRPTPTPKPVRTKGSKVTGEAGGGNTDKMDEGETSPPSEDAQQVSGPVDEAPSGEPTVVPTPTKTPKDVRYPSTTALDQASRVSTSTYALDSGEGQVAEMFRYFASTIRSTSDLSPSEREYYDIFLTYLLAAWSGRVDATNQAPPTPSAELEDFF